MGVCNTAPKGSRSNYLLTGMILQVFHLPFQPPGALVPNRTARPMASWIFRRTSPSVPRSGWFPSSADTRRFDIHGMGGKSGIWCEGTGTWKIVESKWRWSCFVFFFIFFFGRGREGHVFFWVIFPAIMVKQWRHVTIKTMKAWRFLVKEMDQTLPWVWIVWSCINYEDLNISRLKGRDDCGSLV